MFWEETPFSRSASPLAHRRIGEAPSDGHRRGFHYQTTSPFPRQRAYIRPIDRCAVLDQHRERRGGGRLRAAIQRSPSGSVTRLLSRPFLPLGHQPSCRRRAPTDRDAQNADRGNRCGRTTGRRHTRRNHADHRSDRRERLRGFTTETMGEYAAVRQSGGKDAGTIDRVSRSDVGDNCLREAHVVDSSLLGRPPVAAVGPGASTACG